MFQINARKNIFVDDKLNFYGLLSRTGKDLLAKSPESSASLVKHGVGKKARFFTNVSLTQIQSF